MAGTFVTGTRRVQSLGGSAGKHAHNHIMRTQRTYVTSPAMVAAVLPAPNTSPAFRGEISENKQKKNIERSVGGVCGRVISRKNATQRSALARCAEKNVPTEPKAMLHAKHRVNTPRLL